MTYSLKELRARYNLTQVETAARLGVSTTTYNAWESNFGKVKLRDARKVAELFGVNIDQIFFTNERSQANAENSSS